MNTAEQILVVFLSAALAVFLTLAIIVCVQLIKVMRTVQNIADKAEDLVESAEATADAVKSAVGQLSVMRFVSNIFDMVQKHTKHKNKGE